VIGWYSNNFGNAEHPCWTCCKAPEDGEGVREVKKLPTQKEPTAASQVSHNKPAFSFEDLCLMVCWYEVPTCPKGKPTKWATAIVKLTDAGWYSNNKGTGDDPCWTCCKAPEDVFQRQDM
jgi:hypothetical protein